MSQLLVFTGFALTYDNLGTPIAISDADLRLVKDDLAALTFSYTQVGGVPADDIPEATISTNAEAAGLNFSAVDLNADFDQVSIGTVSWDNDANEALALVLTDGSTDYIFQLATLQGEELPNIFGFEEANQQDPLAAFIAFEASISGTGAATGDFAPGTQIDGLDLSYSGQEGSSDDDLLNGDDRGTFLGGGDGNDTIFGNGGDDVIFGDAGSDELYGGNGDDLLDASGGSSASQGSGDIVLPGRGTDTVVGHQELYEGGGGITLSFSDISGEGGLVITSGPDGTGTVTGASGNTTVFDTDFTYVNFIDGSQDGDTITGSDDDQFEGFAGLGGADEIAGGDGFDVAFYNFEADFFGGNYANSDGNGTIGIIADLASNQVTDTQGNNDTLTGIEEIQATNERDILSATGASAGIIFHGLGGNDTITGSGFDDELVGGDDDDTMSGVGGNDTLLGGDGNDLLNGGLNNDRLLGGEGVDTLNGGDGDDVLIDRVGATNTFNGGAGEDRVVSGDGIDIVSGGSERDVIKTYGGADEINGDGGDDVILSGDGHDIVYGGDNDDVIKTGLGNDTVYGGEGNDIIYGWRGDDELYGGAGDDVIRGDFDGDIIEGGAGNDRLVGAPGRDTFIFRDGFEEDRILDFTDRSDLLDFSQHTGVGSIDDLSITQVSTNVVITDGLGGRVVLADTDIADISETDFIFSIA